MLFRSPLAVAPAWQRRGVGTALVEAAIQRLCQTGTAAIYVLGDPRYYRRFGFGQETTVLPPFPVVDASLRGWQSLVLDASMVPRSGQLSVPEPWLKQALWCP